MFDWLVLMLFIHIPLETLQQRTVLGGRDASFHLDINEEISASRYVDGVITKATSFIGRMNASNIREQGAKSAERLNMSDPLYLKYGIFAEALNQPLLVGEKRSLPCEVLTATPHGRHLMIISLLEHPGMPIWHPRSGGKLRIFLPDSLKSAEQPSLTEGACVMDDVSIDGVVQTRKMIKHQYLKFVPDEEDFTEFSWNKEKHRQSIRSLLEWILNVPTFNTSVSLLSTIKFWMNQTMFVELVNLVAIGRSDTGFVMPSMISYMPTAFIHPNQFYVSNLTVKTLSRRKRWTPFDIKRVDSKARRFSTTPLPISSSSLSFQHPTTLIEITSTEQHFHSESQETLTERKVITPTLLTATSSAPQVNNIQKTLEHNVVWHSEEPESYFREDMLANSHHSDWHRLSFGRRKGEFFYYMHGQMQARYEVERLCLSLPSVVDFGPSQWDGYISDSYDPELSDRWSPRNPGTIDSDSLHSSYHEMSRMASAPYYANGVDYGIDGFARIFEERLHNYGHVAISDLSEKGGVMASTIAAMRDPIFYRWHGFIQRMFLEYKDNLNINDPYSDIELSFPGVKVVSAVVHPEMGNENVFYTCRETAEVKIDNLDSTSLGTRMTVQYRRLNHRPFTWNYIIHNELSETVPSVIRVLMLPKGGNVRTTIHMDIFYHELHPGQNYITREELEAPHLSKSRWSLNELQDQLMNGQVNDREFSWGGCGWPRHLNIPRGTEAGMEWDVVVMVSKLLSADESEVRNWSENSNRAWSYCGVQSGKVPDSRPMGFPVDRSFSSIKELSNGRHNWLITPMLITHGVC